MPPPVEPPLDPPEEDELDEEELLLELEELLLDDEPLLPVDPPKLEEPPLAPDDVPPLEELDDEELLDEDDDLLIAALRPAVAPAPSAGAAGEASAGVATGAEDRGAELAPSPSGETLLRPAPAPLQPRSVARTIEEEPAEFRTEVLDAPATVAPMVPESAGPRRELSVEELIDLEQQADFFVVLGQDEAAIDLLMGHVRSSGGVSPLPYLKLLEIYRRRGEHDSYERVRERFNRRFSAYAPDWDVDLTHGRTLESYPGVVPRLRSRAVLETRKEPLVITVIPGSDPIAALLKAVLRAADAKLADPDEWLPRQRRTLTRRPETLGNIIETACAGLDVVLIVDQFEETFTLCTDQEAREQFTRAIAGLVKDPDTANRVILIIRADYAQQSYAEAALQPDACFERRAARGTGRRRARRCSGTRTP